MLNKILVPVDGSETSEQVFSWIRVLSKFKEGVPEFHLLRVFEPPSRVYLFPNVSLPSTNAASDDFYRGEIDKYLEQKVEELSDFKVSSKLVEGDPATEILSESGGCDLILMAGHGMGGVGRWLLGSVTTKVSRGAQVPLLVVGSLSQDRYELVPPNIKKIMVAVDGSEAAERAYRSAASWAGNLGAALFVYQGVSEVDLVNQVNLTSNSAGMAEAENYLKCLADSEEGVEVEWDARRVYGRANIANVAEEIEADLIVMGSHGKGGLQRWLLGSETEQTLQKAKCPVLVTH